MVFVRLIDSSRFKPSGEASAVAVCADFVSSFHRYIVLDLWRNSVKQVLSNVEKQRPFRTWSICSHGVLLVVAVIFSLAHVEEAVQY